MTEQLQEKQPKAPAEYLPAERTKELSSALTEAKQTALTLVVNDEESMNKANDVLIRISTKQKGIDAFRLAIVKPFKDHIAGIDKYFKDLAGQFDEPKEKITNKVLDFRRKKAEKARKEQDEIDRKAAAARAEGNTEKADKIAAKETKTAPVAQTATTEAGRSTYVKDAEWKITNLDLVPGEFWIVDEKKLGKRVREMAKDLELGRIYTDKILGVTITGTERPSLTAGVQE